MQSLRRFAFLALALTCAAGFSVADEGMWLFTRPPTKTLKEKYGFEPTKEWLEHVQKSCVRFSTGGSGSIVSADGLVMTNHHVGSDILEKLSTSEKNLLETGFYARTPAEEIPCPDLELVILWTIDDVTARVTGAAKGMTGAEANTARRKMISTIEEEAEQKTKLDCQVVTLYQGGLYHLYSYKRYAEIKLVMAPEMQAAFFGGDADNFEYPRFDLDFTFFRIYENGKPIAPEHFLTWSRDGAAKDELVFVAGHPGSTQRLNTVAHLKYLRDVRYPVALSNLWRREVKLSSFSGRSAENERIARGDLFGVQNTRKAFTGTLAGLLDPDLMNAKIAAEKKLRAAVDAKPEWKAQWGDAWTRIEAGEKVATELYRRTVGLGGRNLSLGSELFQTAKDLVRYTAEKEKPNAERLPEYGEAGLDSFFLGLYSPAPIYDALEVDRLESALSLMAEFLGADDPHVVRVLAGQSPRERAEALVAGTKLKDVAVRKALAEGGRKAVEASDDPLIKLARELDPDARALRKRWEDEVDAAERDGYAKIAAAKFAIEGENTYPDATFTLRLSYGTIKGYREGSQEIEPFTQLGGMYERAKERAGEKGFELPEQWGVREASVKKDTPCDFVSTCDIIGGNSGSPTINQKGEVVGLIFDGNIQSLSGGIAYTDEQARAVSVDSRAMIESLRKVYDAGALADEIVGSGP